MSCQLPILFPVRRKGSRFFERTLRNAITFAAEVLQRAKMFEVVEMMF